MKMWQAMQLLEEGEKVRCVAWEKSKYIWKNDEGDYVNEEGEYINEGGKSTEDYIYLNSGVLSAEWEIYEERKDVPLAWRMLYKKMNEAEEFIDDYMNTSYLCYKCECENCGFRSACCAFYNLYEILEELNKDYKLDVKHEYEVGGDE